MKKTAISIVLLGVLCVPNIMYASAAKYSVTSVFASQVPLTKVLEKLGRTTNRQFFYSVSDLEDIYVDDSKINYNSLEGTLAYLKKNYSIDFIIKNNNVTVRKRENKIDVKKQLLSSNTGKYNDTISEREKDIDEVVLVGYGKQNKKDVTGSISSIDEKQMKGVATGNFGDAIAGKVTGVQITQTNASPGSSPTIRVRGIGTITAGSNPLIVVDGLPLTEGSNLNSIDPNSIAKIDILKDAASASIYGFSRCKRRDSHRNQTGKKRQNGSESGFLLRNSDEK
ncbi:hypothetical protein J3D55_003185 [Chryseobacterium ginsenosidimutans]|uniref:DUF4974 domain-containing protein n=1 Tax=Chryseobacterium ginsenosidimutans TaxID=687846 RepID=UPI0021693A50|nr:TonB-dependent receptor plug domain-containing protein [Chryseobacterium ginsenosidimutans]MCS3870269.1 hypothetical protein [Chryseobacterium ginsenosidimutans]